MLRVTLSIWKCKVAKLVTTCAARPVVGCHMASVTSVRLSVRLQQLSSTFKQVPYAHPRPIHDNIWPFRVVGHGSDQGQSEVVGV